MRASRWQQRGVVLMGLMVLLAIGSVALATFTESAAVARQRAKEDELLWIGRQYRAALESYYRSTPGPIKHMPVSLEELVRDNRFPQPVRHLRKLYADPIAPDAPWGLMRRGAQIIGIYSQAEGAPFRRTRLGPGLESLEGADHYSDWRFMFIPRALPAGTAPSPARAASSASPFNSVTP